MQKQVLTKELLDQMRSIDGFPLGKNEDIVALSDPPYYTACPNPWIEDFIKETGTPWDPKTDSYNREPFAADVSEGKNDPIYNAHTYHTKVPHKAIMWYILHYTDPGDIVFDGFCGTGMTGVAAQICGNPDLEFKERLENVMPSVKWGIRRAILNDLSPAATFIAYNFNTPVDLKTFETEAKQILSEVEEEYGWMYETQHVIDGEKIFDQDIDGLKRPVIGKINYTVWSDIFTCPNCSNEIVFWESAVNKETDKVKDEFFCPTCGSKVTKRSIERVWESIFDPKLNKTIQRAKQVPILINYSIKGKNGKNLKFEKKPDDNDFKLIKKIEISKIPNWYPTYPMMFKGNEWGDTWRAGYPVTYVHDFYTKRNLFILSLINFKINSKPKNISPKLKLLFNSQLINISKLNRYRPNVSYPYNPLNGTLYVSSQISEANIFTALENKIDRFVLALKQIKSTNLVFTQSNSDLSNIPPNSIDYIFTDPPFGANLQYSELNFLWEAWMKVFTSNKLEAVINKTYKKGLMDYQHIMEKCFEENYRILKPGRWITVEFHNSQNSVWMAIQESLQRAGFVIADVRTLDKQQGAFNQVQSITLAVKQDLIISAYKPNEGLEDRFKLSAGTMEGVWDFVRQHLKHLPVFVEKNGIVQLIIERQSHLLFDRMIAFHVQRGVIVPISAGDFYTGLRQRFPERDDMYFLEDQVLEYDKKRMISKRIEQVSLFVHDEKSAVQWLHKELNEKSETYQDIQPKFLQELHQDKFEKLPELTIMLEQNFLQDLQGKWYVPDPNKQADLDKVREKALLKEFEEYKKIKGKLKLFRTEAIRVGFKRAWSERDYSMIIKVGERLPPQILQEDDVLLMYYDNALTRQGKS